MTRNITRKQSTGETGNPGEFGTRGRSEPDVGLSVVGANARLAVSRSLERADNSAYIFCAPHTYIGEGLATTSGDS